MNNLATTYSFDTLILPPQYGQLMKNFPKMFCTIKNSCIFALELVNDETDSRVYGSGVFISANLPNSIWLLNPSDSRCEALSVSSKSGFSSFFYCITFLIREMTRPIKECSPGKNSTLNRNAHDTGKQPLYLGKPPRTLRVSFLGIYNNDWTKYVAKSVGEYFVEKTKGHIFAERRLINKIEMADKVFRSDMIAFRGTNIIIK